MVRSRILIFAGFVCCFCTPSAARATATVIDSSGNRMGWEIVSRLNSAGHFPFTGSIVNRHVNADINIALEYQRWGLFLFKSHDLEQRDSPVNYFQPGVFRSISITPDIDVRFFFGYVFSQASSFRDPDSDFYAAPVLYWNIGSGLKLENCALFFDLSSVAKLANRVKMIWTTGSVSLEAFVWHRWVMRQDPTCNFCKSGFRTSSAPRFKINRTCGVIVLSGLRHPRQTGFRSSRRISC